MKKLVLFFLCVSLTMSLFSQTDKGQSAMGLDLQFISTKTGTKGSEEKHTTAHVIPNYNYFIVNNLSIGARLGYSYDKRTNPTSDYKSHYFTFGPQLRYYWHLNDMFAVAPQLAIPFNYGMRYSGKTKYANEWSISPTLTTSFVIFPHPEHGIEFSYGSLGYFYGKSTPTASPANVYTNSGFAFDFGPSTLRLGYHWYFGKSKSK